MISIVVVVSHRNLFGSLLGLNLNLKFIRILVIKYFYIETKVLFKNSKTIANRSQMYWKNSKKMEKNHERLQEKDDSVSLYYAS